MEKEAGAKPEFNPELVDKVVQAAKDLLKRDGNPDMIEAIEMESAIELRERTKTPFADRYAMDAATGYVQELDNQSRSGSAEWEELSTAVDKAAAPNDGLTSEQRQKKLMEAQMSAQPQGVGI